MREIVFLLVLSVAAGCVVVGVASWSPGLAWIVAGLLLAPIAWLGLAGDDDGKPSEVES